MVRFGYDCHSKRAHQDRVAQKGSPPNATDGSLLCSGSTHQPSESKQRSCCLEREIDERDPKKESGLPPDLIDKIKSFAVMLRIKATLEAAYSSKSLFGKPIQRLQSLLLMAILMHIIVMESCSGDSECAIYVVTVHWNPKFARSGKQIGVS